MVTRHFLCGRSITILDTAACLSSLLSSFRISMSSCRSLPYSLLPAYQPGAPGVMDAEPQADRIDLLTHRSSPRTPLLRPDAPQWSGSRTALKIGRPGGGPPGGTL